ncbi:hypothetical protein [Parerythrobacter lacustris]|uniref:Helix-turn-helix domain-containing protein n=1 Tax=Parerythrobacter lacustris TaxID=2969984 RepID=A0ABT1XP92_9SPHN|nr:hypothetical protein [Parerythrobacter lacustris]MCR2833471.1 hypothetical protein [Parerythrobacter lacustris]
MIAAVQGGETQANVARRYSVDHSTVSYHLHKYENSYPEQGGVYAVIRAQARKACSHPSTRCTLCGHMADLIFREDKATIATLTKQLAEARSRLRVAGLPVE